MTAKQKVHHTRAISYNFNILIAFCYVPKQYSFLIKLIITEQAKSASSEQSKSQPPVKIKQEKKDSTDEKKESPEKKLPRKEGPALPPVSKRLNDDAEAPEVPKLLG